LAGNRFRSYSIYNQSRQNLKILPGWSKNFQNGRSLLVFRLIILCACVYPAGNGSLLGCTESGVFGHITADYVGPDLCSGVEYLLIGGQWSRTIRTTGCMTSGFGATTGNQRTYISCKGGTYCIAIDRTTWRIIGTTIIITPFTTGDHQYYYTRD
jgi:hypothetical protein